MSDPAVSDLKGELHRKLQAGRAVMLSKVENLGEYDRRRPMTPTGTNLLGLVKHLAGLEYAYLGEPLGHPAPERMSWVEDGSIWEGADMWATPDESSEYITGLYRRACAHADGVIAALDLEAPGSVAHWPEDRRNTTLGVLLIRMVAETAQHAGHADILRELIDGTGGPDHDTVDEATWRQYVAGVQAAADTFATDGDAKAARLGNISFDCADVLKLAAFWSAVLGRPVDPGSSEFFASIGGADGRRREPAWYFNLVAEPKRAKNRVHVDLVNPHPAAVEELVRLGATVIGEHEVPGQPWTVLQDPEGNEFCIAAKSYPG